MFSSHSSKRCLLVRRGNEPILPDLLTLPLLFGVGTQLEVFHHI